MKPENQMQGLLAGLRIVEFAGIGPGPFACMMLADHGAEVIRIERPNGVQAGPDVPTETDILLRSRKRMFIDLKSENGRHVLKDLIAKSDGIVEGYRPGVMERLGLGPDDLMKTNPALVYGRMTGWGQSGPYSNLAGHDINYIAVTGALHAFGRKGEAPVPPINMVGDFGGGAMMLAYGMLAGILAARTTGKGTVVDAAMTDGAALLMSMIYTFMGQGTWKDERGVNLLDTGAHFYDVYETKDGRYISLGAIEPKFYAEMLARLGLSEKITLAAQMDPGTWDGLKTEIAAVIKTKTREDWDVIFEGSDACYAPVMSLSEAPKHPHNAARTTFIQAGGVTQPAPAPRYSTFETRPPEMSDQSSHTREILVALGYDTAKIEGVLAAGGID